MIPLVTLIITAIFILFPVRTIINKCLGKRAVDDIKYEDHFENFMSDYDRENPVTKKEGF